MKPRIGIGRIPFDLGVDTAPDYNTYTKAGTVVGDLDAAGTSRLKRGRKRATDYPFIPREIPPVVSVKSGGVVARLDAGATRQTIKERRGKGLATLRTTADKAREYQARIGGAVARYQAASRKVREYAERHATGRLTSHSHGQIGTISAEHGSGALQPRTSGLVAILRGDDSEELYLLGLLAEEEELLLLA